MSSHTKSASTGNHITRQKLPTKKQRRTPEELSDIEILAAAHVSDKVPRHILDELPPQQSLLVTTGRLQGERLVYVHWLTGECALMFCRPGKDTPPLHLVIKAYRENPGRLRRAGVTR